MAMLTLRTLGAAIGFRIGTQGRGGRMWRHLDLFPEHVAVVSCHKSDLCKLPVDTNPICASCQLTQIRFHKSDFTNPIIELCISDA